MTNKIKIENVQVGTKHASCGIRMFAEALRDIEPGQSFEFDGFKGHHSNILTAAQILLGTQYAKEKTSDGKMRIGRVS